MTTTKSGARLRREAAGFTRAALGREVGVSPATLFNIERGYRPADEVAQRLSEVLGCTVDELFDPAPA